MPAPRQPPKRRRGEGRQAILDAAQELFAAEGYQGVSLRDIAGRADISEPLIFRYFGTKAKLFEEAVNQPYHAFVSDFIERWRELEGPLSNREMIERFVRDLHEFATAHKDLLSALVAARRFAGAAGGSGASGLGAEVAVLAEQAAAEADWRNFGDIDLPLTVACTVSMVFGAVLLDDLVLAEGSSAATRQRLLAEICEFAVAGILRQST